MAAKADKMVLDLEKKPASESAGEKWDHQQEDYYANKKSKISESESHSSTESEVRSHPIGGHIWSKRHDKSKIKLSKQAIENREKMQQIEEEMKKLKGMELEQKKIEFEQKEIELLQKDYDIVLKDTSRMTDAQREFYFKFVDEIRARRKW